MIIKSHFLIHDRKLNKLNQR